MPAMPVDISWQVLRQIIRDWAGASADLAEVKPLDGGSVSTTLALTTTSGDRAVLKITPHRVDRAYADEAFQLTLLRDVGVPAPRVYRWEIGTLDHPFSYLLMEYIDGSDLPAVRECCAADVFDQVQAELSYMEQFHTVTPAFLRTYQQSQRLAPEYHRVRKPVYQLYEMLNHLYVFGPEYLKPTLAAVERVSPLV